MLTALLTAAPLFVFADSNKLEPITAVPIEKNDKAHHETKAHDEAHVKHVQKTKDEYIKELTTAIAEAKTFVEAKKDAKLHDQALMKISIAEQWLKTIEEYKDPATRYVRSVNYATNELKSAKHDVKAKFKAHSIANGEEEKILQKLAHKKSMLEEERKKATLHDENDILFKMMMKAADDYIQFASKPEHKESFAHLKNRAYKYLSDAHKILHAHMPHAHSHKAHKAAAHETITATPAITTPAAEPATH